MSASDEDDDFYAPVSDKDITEDGDDYGDEEDDEEESDSDVEFIIERPASQIPAPALPADIKPPTRATVTITAPNSASIATPSPAHSGAQALQGPSSASVTDHITENDIRTKYGVKLPPVRTSTVDVNKVPEWEPIGKPITQIDIDVDLAEKAKPWRMAGADQSDYFNYGFDEFTWASYCIRQQNMAGIVQSQKAEAEKFEMMTGVSISGGGHMSGPPGGPGSGPGGMMMGPNGPMMPGMDEQTMHQAMSYLMSQGIDSNNLSFDDIMQQVQQMQQMQGPGMGPGMPPQGMMAPQGPGGPPQGMVHQQGPQAGGGGGGGQWGNQKMRRW